MYAYDEERIETIKIGEGTNRVARVGGKVCTECGTPILVGQRYGRQPWKIDGEMWVQTIHWSAKDCAYHDD